jgi:ADP-heptose:LPS heptosyltransferase
MQIRPNTIIISRTDSIGDVILTLPMCGAIKEEYPNCKIIFFGNTYTLPVLKTSKHVDDVVDWWTLKNLPEKAQIEEINKLNADSFIHVFPNKHRLSIELALTAEFITCLIVIRLLISPERILICTNRN